MAEEAERPPRRFRAPAARRRRRRCSGPRRTARRGRSRRRRRRAPGPRAAPRRYSRFSGVSASPVHGAGVARDVVEVAAVVDARRPPCRGCRGSTASGSSARTRSTHGVRLGAVADEVAEHDERGPRCSAGAAASTASSASMLAWMSERIKKRARQSSPIRSMMRSAIVLGMRAARVDAQVRRSRTRPGAPRTAAPSARGRRRAAGGRRPAGARSARRAARRARPTRRPC